jgi:hypothetical protein
MTRTTVPRTASFALTATLTLAACQRSPHEPAPGASPPSAAALPAAPAHATASATSPPGAASTLQWDDPPGWQRVPPASPMRRAQYRVPKISDDEHDAEVTVITFGPGQGGDTEANLERWYGQVTQPDGHPTREVATRRVLTAGPFRVTVTEASGRLNGSSMPGLPATPTIEHGRLLAAIVETPQGPWFFKMTGGDHTVAAARPAFEAMLHSVREAPVH